MINSYDPKDRARGAIVGLACGDALGAPVEFESRDTIASRFPTGLRDFTSGGWMEVVPGELTDDSRMMLDLADSLVGNRQVDLDDLGRRFVAWADEAPKDIGNTTRLAIDLLRSGVPWSEAGQRALDTMGSSKAASNGSVMRCAPVAVRFRSDPVQLRTVSVDTSRITHAEPRCVWSCVAINQAIAHGLNGCPPDELMGAALAGIEQPEVVSSLQAVSGMTVDRLRGTGFVLNAVQIALWAVLNTPTFEEAVVAAVMVGNDTDTNAAVTGAVAGAHHGYRAIPERWRSQVHEQERLIMLADQLFALSAV